MHFTFTSSWNAPYVVLFQLSILALFHNWTNGILANHSLAYEKHLIAEFRDLVQDLATKDFMKSDGYLLRWLRYTNFDVEKAHKAFEDSLNWRKENDIDNVRKEGYSSIEENYPYSFNGFDIEGRPVVFIAAGTYNIRKIIIAGEQDKYQRAVFRGFEVAEAYLQEIRDRTGFDNMTQGVVVFDLAGFNLQQTACLNCLKMAPDYINAYEPNYPYICHKIFVINAPAISYSAIQLAKHFMAQETKEALKVFDHDKDKWSKALLEQISPENLPIKYGGIKLNFDKALFAIRNAAIMHLLGDRKGVAKPTVNANYNGHKVTTSASASHYQSLRPIKYNLEENKSSSSTFVGQNMSIDSESVKETQDYHPISWFDSAITSLDRWTASEDKLAETNNKIFSLTKSTMHNNEREIYPHNGNQKHKHHHYKKITRSDEQFTSSVGNSTATGQIYSYNVAAANNLCTGICVLLMTLIFTNFLIFIY